MLPTEGGGLECMSSGEVAVAIRWRTVDSRRLFLDDLVAAFVRTMLPPDRVKQMASVTTDSKIAALTNVCIGDVQGRVTTPKRQAGTKAVSWVADLDGIDVRPSRVAEEE